MGVLFLYGGIWGEWGGFPSHSSIPAKAGIFAVMDAFGNRGIPLRGKRFLPSQEWNGGIPAKINILPIPAKAGISLLCRLWR